MLRGNENTSRWSVCWTLWTRDRLIKIVASLKIFFKEEFKGLFWFCLFNVVAFSVNVMMFYILYISNVYFQKSSQRLLTSSPRTSFLQKQMVPKLFHLNSGHLREQFHLKFSKSSTFTLETSCYVLGLQCGQQRQQKAVTY